MFLREEVYMLMVTNTNTKTVHYSNMNQVKCEPPFRAGREFNEN